MKLTEGFQLLAAAQDGIAQLRELILSLAMQGKLVPQEPSDEPAQSLLKKIRVDRHRLIGEGAITKDKPLPNVSEGEKPFQLPETWEWVRLGSVSTRIQYGLTASARHDISSPKFVRITDIQHGRVAWETVPGVLADERTASSFRLGDGDILIARTGGTIGKSFLVSDVQTDAVFASYLIRISPIGIHPRYIKAFLESRIYWDQLYAKTMGTGQPNVNGTALSQLVLPCPPLLEQVRIVERVDDLMHLCDELEARGRLEAELHARLTATLFDTLAASESSHALAENWSRIAAHFDLLLDRPEAIDALQQTILQLAVRGLLVSQDPNDAPASVVLDEVRATRDRLSSLGKMSRSQTLSEERDELPTAPRLGWEMVTFPDLCVIGGGATPSKSKAVYWDGKLPWVSPKDMKVEHISDAQDHVSELALDETRLPLVPQNSLLIVVRGMILAHSFPVGITQVDVTINQDMKSLTPLVPALVPYLALVCRGFKYEILNLVDRSTHGTCKLQSDKLFAFRFGLPPLAEQSRILARVEEMRRLCEALRERLTARRTCQARLAEALVEQAASSAPGQTDDLAAAA